MSSGEEPEGPKAAAPTAGRSPTALAGEDELSPPPDSEGAERLQSLMRRAFEADDTPKLDVLGGVQQKLRDRSGGKFYDDGWSTRRHPPFATYFITSLMMLAVIAIIYAILTPLVGDPVSKPPEPEPVPVQILPPR